MKKFPTEGQVRALKSYLNENNDFSIYGKDGIYEKLEKNIVKKYNVKHCILTNTGTSSLSSAYFGFGLKRDDEVIVPIYTFIATVTPLFRLGCVPVFADANPRTGLISPESVERLVTKKTKAVAVTHMWGLPCDMRGIKRICDKHNLLLLEDVSHAHLTKYEGRLLGTWGDVGCFSVGAKKIISGGEGGFLITNNDEIYLRATLLGHFVDRAEETLKEMPLELRKKYEGLSSGFGENYRMHPYAAVMINEFFKKETTKLIDCRYKTLRKLYKALLGMDGILPQKVVYGAMYGFKPKIVSKNFDIIIKEMNKAGFKMKKLDTCSLFSDKIFRTNMTDVKCKFQKKYPGVDEYMKGRVSIPNSEIDKFEDNENYFSKYLKYLKKCLK